MEITIDFTHLGHPVSHLCEGSIVSKHHSNSKTIEITKGETLDELFKGLSPFPTDIKIISLHMGNHEVHGDYTPISTTYNQTTFTDRIERKMIINLKQTQ